MTTTLNSSTIDRIASELTGDIRRRGLRPGDRYLTAAEASKVFDVSSMTMHRAMTLLAKREVLVRQRSRGTFVGPKFAHNGHDRQVLDVLHLVMAMDYHRTQSFSSDVLVDYFSQSLPGVTVEVHHLAEGTGERHIDHLGERIAQDRREGVVLMRCSQPIQLRVSQLKLCAVVYGQSYPGVELPCVKHDQESVGRYMAEFALARGAERFALLTHAHWRFGDHQMIDAATATLAASGVQLDSVKIRSLPPEREVVMQVVQDILREKDAPDAFFCRNDFYAQIVHDVVLSNDGSRAREPWIVSGGHAPRGGETDFSRVVSSLTLQEQVEHIATLLSAAASGAQGASKSVVIPVEFTVSSATK